MKLFHGSQTRDFIPTYGLGRDDHDYGRGFYTTAEKELGREWAVGQQSAHDGWLHVYEIDLAALKVFDFGDAGELAWIAELMKHRPADDSPTYLRDARRFIAKYGVDVSGYDIIKGWRADASYFFIAQMFTRNQVDVSLLKELLSLGDLGLQYFIKSPAAFAALHELEDEKEAVSVETYRPKFNRRDVAAHQKMRELVYDLNRNKLERVFSDLLKEEA